VQEFGHLGEMLSQGGLHLSTRSATPWLYRLDRDADGKLSEAELDFTVPPAAHPSVGKRDDWRETPCSPRAPAAGRSAVGLDGRSVLTEEELAQSPPSCRAAPILRSTCRRPRRCPKIISQARADQLHLGSLPYRTKYVDIFWEVDTADGGGFQDLLRRRGSKFEQEAYRRFHETDAEWLASANVSMWTRVTAEFFGLRAIGLPKGNDLVQHLGFECSVNVDGTRPYVLDDHH